MIATEEHYDAAYLAYYEGIASWQIIENRNYNMFLVMKRELSGPIISNDDPRLEATEKRWEFSDEITAKRFVMSKILEVITDAVLEVKGE